MGIIHQIGDKLRVQIAGFSGELSKSLKKVGKRFTEEIIYGILSSGSVHLTEISRSLEEGITMHKTHDRLCRNLGCAELEEEIGIAILKKGSSYVEKETLIVIDPTEIIKPYAEKMEYLTKVRDGSTKEIRNGYWIIQAVATDVEGKRIIPLVSRLYSTVSPDFESENRIIQKAVQDIYDFTGYNGTIVFDRGGDRRELLVPWTSEYLINYIVRQVGERHLHYGRQLISALDIAEKCKMHYRETTIMIKDGKTVVTNIDFGFAPVRLPEFPERLLNLVVVKGFGKKPMMLLTTLDVKNSRKNVWRIVRSYLSRWKIEETIRFIKQSYKLEDIRLLTYRRLKNMITFVLSASYFICVHLGLSERLKILAAHAVKAAKRLFGIPDFNYYCIQDGVKSIFMRTQKGILNNKQNSPPDSKQLLLFS
ncbi:MAG TPA: hypothetical protein PLZ43_16455 [bacterium]|nr:hypothetical protein [bacterium]